MGMAGGGVSSKAKLIIKFKYEQAGLSWGSVQAETVSLEPCLAHSYKLLIYKLALK